MGGGSQPVAATSPSIAGLSIQSSVLGGVRPLYWGRVKIPANLLAYYDFVAVPHTSKQASGGKGGSPAANSTTDYTYQAAVMWGLGDSLVRQIVRAWKDKLIYGASTVNASNNQATDTIIVPDNNLYTVGLASVYVANIQVRAGQIFTEGKDYTHDGAGNYAFDPSFQGKTVAINYLVSDATATPSALPALGLELAAGWEGQPAWPYLVTTHPDQAIGYSGLAHLRAAAFDLGSNAEVGNISYEVSTFSEFSKTIFDARPAQVLQEFLTDGRNGAGWLSSKLGDLTAYDQATIAQGIFISPVLDTQQAAADQITYLLSLTNADCLWSEGQLKIVPLVDEVVSGNGVTFTPDLTPVYDLDESHYLADGDTAPVVPTIKASDDCFNKVQLEFFNRDNAYNTDLAQWSDDADIFETGLRADGVMEAHAICDADIAAYVARIIGQRQLSIRRIFTAVVPWIFSLLEPLDLVTLTESQLGLFRLPVGINSIEEGDDNSLTMEFEERPIGHASAPRYGVEETIGFAHDFNAKPGPVVTPFFFEPPIELTTTGLEVWTAVTGNTPAWGGAIVWASLDNETYAEVGRVVGGARYGTLVAPIGTAGTDTVQVQLRGLGGQVLPGTVADANADHTLLFVGDAAGGEYQDYQDATLTGANGYSLTTLLRGRYGSVVAAHAAGQTVVRVDQAIAKSDPLALSMVGSTIYFKFTSFNVYGGGYEDLADAAAYPYTITGAMLKLPPSDVASLSATFETGGIRLQWPPIPDQDLADYELRTSGTSWETASPLTSINGTNYLWGVQLAGNHVVWIKAFDIYGNPSRDATSITVNVPAPNATNLVASIVGPNVRLDWSVVTGAYQIDHFLVSMGPSPIAQTVINAPLSTRFEILAQFLGTQFFGVAAVDVAGNVGPFVYAQVDIVAPSAPIGGNANHPAQEVIDNNVLLYWQAPVTGTLPIASYDVRKGASNTPIGSNGNSTFTTVFEQQSGVFTYSIQAIDTAGNEGPALVIAATVNQPPDFVLRSSIDSTFGGALVGMYAEIGRLYGPSFGETWDQHFTGRAWASPQDQIAAGSPLYFEPSATSGSYEEIIDYGVTLPGTNITVTLTANQLSGSTTVATQISYKAALSDPWTDATAGATSTFATNFRYVKVHFDLAAAGGDDLVELAALNIKLSVKLQNDSGDFYANAGDAGGTWVPFNVVFLDAETPRLTPNGTTPLIAISDFVDAPNPTGFYVYLFDLSGNRASGGGGWATRGF